MDPKIRNTVGIRKDRGWVPLIVFAVMGFLLGAGVVAVVAIHETWLGGGVRHYPASLYIMAGLFGAVFTVIAGAVFSWAFDVMEEEYFDPEDEEEEPAAESATEDEKEGEDERKD